MFNTEASWVAGVSSRSQMGRVPLQTKLWLVFSKIRRTPRPRRLFCGRRRRELQQWHRERAVHNKVNDETRMPTGVWSRRMQEANERQGFVPGGGMVAACVILCSVIGLGFRLKLQVARSFLNDFVQDAYVNRVDKARRAAGRNAGGGGRTSSSDFEQERAYERARQQAHQQAHQRTAGGAAAGGSKLDQHRTLLQVSRGASRGELKNAYYAAVRRCHPDAVGGAADSAGSQMAALKLAHDTLAREARR